MLRVEPEIIANDVANGTVQLAFWHILDYGPSPVAHQAAECAGAQAPLKFWEMHDQLFARQAELWSNTEQVVTDIAVGIGLDGPAFAACLADPAIAEKVARLDQERRTAGIRLRPTFDINGRLVPGAQPYAGLATLFADILAQ